MIYVVRGANMPTVVRSGEGPSQPATSAKERQVSQTDSGGKTKPRERRSDGEPEDLTLGQNLDLKA